MLKGAKKYLSQLRDSKINNNLSEYYSQRLAETNNRREAEAIIYISSLLSFINWDTPDQKNNNFN